MNDKSAWNNFLETGKIGDYLDYCQDRKQELFAAYTAYTEGAAHASDNQRDRVVDAKDG